MSLFIDASALVAILAEEPEREEFEQRLAGSGTNLWSAMVAWETVSALSRSYRQSIVDARHKVGEIAQLIGLVMVPIDEGVSETALSAYQIYGRGSRHPAHLNMGDCFAYACAKMSGSRLLYKGNDFAETDLA